MLKNHVIDLTKADGTSYAGLRGHVAKGQTLHIEAKIGEWRLEAGDTITVHQGDGAVVSYRVLRPNFYDALTHTAAHYQASLEPV